MNKIDYGFITVEREKYERQDKFKKRAVKEYREKIKTFFKYDFKGKDYNMIIYRLPLADPNGYAIMGYQISDKVLLDKLKMKYVTPKIKFEVEEQK